MLFKVRTIGLHAVLLCHSLKAQQGYMWIRSAEGMPWTQVLSLLPLVWFLGPITTYLAAFPGTSRPSILAFLDAIFADPVRIGPSWGTVRLPLFIHFFSFIYSIHIQVFGFPHYAGGKPAKMVMTIKILPLWPSKLAIHRKRYVYNIWYERACLSSVHPSSIY